MARRLNANDAKGTRRLEAGGRLRKLLNYLALAHLLLPHNGRAYEEDMPLSKISALLFFHSHVEAKIGHMKKK